MPVGTNDLTHDEQILLLAVAAHFVVERLECRWGEGARAEEEEAEIVGTEEVVELGSGEARVKLALGVNGRPQT